MRLHCSCHCPNVLEEKNPPALSTTIRRTSMTVSSLPSTPHVYTLIALLEVAGSIRKSTMSRLSHTPGGKLHK